MALGVVLGDRVPGGLEVDDDQPALRVALQPVGAAADAHPLGDDAVEVDLGADLGELAATRRVPGREGGQHRPVPLELVGRIPRGLERQRGPLPFQLGQPLSVGHGRVGHQRVHQRAQGGGELARTGAAVSFGQPAQRAVGEGLSRRRAQGDGVPGLGGTPQRFVGARLGQAVPLRRVGAGHPGGGQARQLRCRAGTLGVVGLRRAHHCAQPADHRGGGEHRRRGLRPHRLVGGGPGGVAGQFGDERGRRRHVLAGVAVDGGDQQPPPCAAHRGDQQPAFLGQQRCPVGDLLAQLADTVEDVEQPSGAQHPAARGGVGPQPLLQAGDDDGVPVAAQRGVRGQHLDGLTLAGDLAARRRQPQGGHVAEQSGQRRARGPGDVVLGDVEQGADPGELPVGQPHQAAALPGLPQRVARIVGSPVRAGRAGEHRADPGHRPGQGGRQRRRRTAQRPGHRPAAAVQRAAQLAQRHRVHPPDRTGEQGDRLLVVGLPAGDRRQHRQQRAHRRLLGDRGRRGRGLDGHPGLGQRADQPRGGGHRPHDHRQLRPRHPVDEVGAAQGVGDQGRLGRRGGGDFHAHRSRVTAGPRQRAPGCARQRRRHRADGAGDRRRAAVRPGQFGGGAVQQQPRLGAAEAEHGLVGVAGDDGLLDAGGQRPHQPGGLRVEVLGVVDEQQPHPGAFGGQ